ncbi:neurogenic locus notch homolog protein 1 [Leptonychotes weddellii]|uniref:Neurogenic locus notch homolog protein 1 n=1 Tax=Leptonychotes weddellii TaxID=9713 RepID=A0A7F8QA49_LEPWE|nr:neurogenic locus notch homolog protein 1 [Leptonychotes weddellii]
MHVQAEATQGGRAEDARLQEQVLGVLEAGPGPRGAAPVPQEAALVTMGCSDSGAGALLAGGALSLAAVAFSHELGGADLSSCPSPGLRCSQPSESCLNGGKCEVFPNGTEACVCSGAFVGQRCQAPSPCLSAPCKNAGTCHVVDRGGLVDYICTCRLGFSGPLCLTPQDNACLSTPCRNGGTCDLLTLTEYKCRCPPGWSGKTCQQADPCASNPCANGGQCLPFEASYICGCPHGFHGPTCRQDVNECSQNPRLCQNGGTCHNEVGSYRCTCRTAHTGPHCELPYVPCSPSPCQNGGTCRPTGDTTHECACLPGFTGQNCEENVDDCPGNNCKNGGACVDGVNTYNCRCPPEWTGQYCTEDVDECQLMPNACQNGGTCHNSHGGYNCVCVNGWTGEDCSENIDDCASAACFHGATCHDRVASFYCECPHGRTGLLCHLNDACISNPCNEGSNCDTNPVNGKAICTCPSGYTGPACSQDVDECSLGANPCEHAGKCINTLGSFECQCLQGYTGPRCEIDVNECISNPCQNEATCLDQIGEFQCICMPGYEGVHCEVNTDECASSPCLQNGRCLDKINEFLCECSTGFTGHLCQYDVDECASTPCKNGAKCLDGPNTYTCVCTEGYTGPHCEVDIDECDPDPCHYGVCKDGVATFTCLCRPGYTGHHCESNINECHSQPCRHGGTCQDRDNAYLCSCLKGTTGPNCETNLDDCVSSPCDSGTCLDKIDGYECACEPGYTGSMCNVNIDECAGNPCHHGGTCEDGVNSFTCRCPEGYHGPTCLSEVNECSSDPCIHGACRDSLNGYKCDCDPGWSGANCDVNNDECESNPCANGGACRDMTSGYVCTCREGFSGPNCQTNINECASNPCLNQGSCIDDVAGYKCNCPLPYTGATCEVVLAPCAPGPCRNGGVCKESEDYESFSCICPTGWQGQTCEVDINECVKSPCRNGASCQNTNGGYRCRCRAGYTGHNCETDVDDCRPNPCHNGGSCTDGVNTAFCDCLPGFRGPFCEEDINECASNPCRHGANCTDCVDSYTCTCPTGFSGIHCENNTPDCTESSCFNGGTCVDGINSFTCLCPPGFTGSYCQHDVNECDSRPCLHGGTCQDSYGTYKCTCPQGYTGLNCQVSQRATGGPGRSPLYDQYCKDHFGDGHCDQGCNSAECEWDGLDCAEHVPERLAAGALVLVVLTPPAQLRNNSLHFLRELSRLLHTNVVFKRDAHGQPMIFPYYGREEELRKHPIKRAADAWAAPGALLDRVEAALLPRGLAGRRRRELDPMDIRGSIVYLEIDNRQCVQSSSQCFQSATDVAAFLGALASLGSLNIPYKIEAVQSETVEPPPPPQLHFMYVAVAAFVLLFFVGCGVLLSRKRRRQHGQLWFPEGFKVSEASKKKRREPLGEDSVGLKPLKNASDGALMDDNQNEWGDEDLEAKKFRFEEPVVLPDLDDQTDHRQWTQQHLDAADLRVSAMAPTPPQGEADTDCMDVNVRGPDGFTPLMIASCSGGGLETGNSEEEEDAPAVISDFIYQGASLHNQTDRTGETALHLAARYSRSDAAKRLLEASADANIQDNMGRTPLHAAVSADAQGVFQILIRNRATDLDARMHDGTTPLILAARLAVEGMLEDLINSHADVNAVDDLGKSALHWAAAVNNVEAAVVLLKNGANKDMQNNKEETPLFLAAREGSYETAKVLLDHFANRDITDHMDRLPRDIAQERMHHDIVRLLDEYSLVRSPQLHGPALGGAPTLSPPLCSPNGYLGNLKPAVPGKKARKPSTKGLACGGKEAKDLKARRKKSQDGKGCLLDSSSVLSPVDSLESPHGYLSDVASPPLLSSPFQQSPSVPLSHLPGMPDAHLGAGHLSVAAKPEMAALGAGGRLAFEAGPPRLSHLPVASSTGAVLGTAGAGGGGGAVNFTVGGTVGGAAGLNGQCEWLSRLQNGLMPNQYNPLRGNVASGPLSTQAPALQHGMMGPLHAGLSTTAALSQMMSYQALPNTRLAGQPHLVQTQPLQQVQQQQQNLQLQQPGLQPPNVQQPQGLPPQPHLSVSSAAGGHLGRSFLGGEPSQADVQPLGPSSLAVHTILPQDSQALPTALPATLAPPMTTAQFLTPPSQHSYSSSPADNTPSHQLQVPEHPFLTPSPESPDQWSSSSPHSHVSDWSEGISSPPTSTQSHIAHIPEALK